jgi:DivIVA domain-containing protein
MQVPEPSFRQVRFAEGYRPEDVDALLAEVLPQLRAGRPATGLAEHIARATFRPSKVRGGYDQDDVDAYLDELVGLVRASTARLRPDRDGRGEGASVPATGTAPPPPRFAATRWREGYEPADVDAFVDEVRRLIEVGPVPVGLPDRITNATFEPTKFREGYAQDEVDDYLDVLVAAARQAVEHARSVPLTPAEAAVQAEALARPGRGPDGARFPRAGKVSTGYRVDEVDALARRVARELSSAAPSLRPGDLGAQRLGRQRAGYRTDLVDAWLADLEAHLARRALG